MLVYRGITEGRKLMDAEAFIEIERKKFENDGLFNLEKDWDSYGADPFTIESFDYAGNILRKLYGLLDENRIVLDFPQMLPCPSNTFDFNWENRIKLILNVGINFKHNYVDAFGYLKIDGKLRDEIRIANEDELPKLAEWIVYHINV